MGSTAYLRVSPGTQAFRMRHLDVRGLTVEISCLGQKGPEPLPAVSVSNQVTPAGRVWTAEQRESWDSGAFPRQPRLETQDGNQALNWEGGRDGRVDLKMNFLYFKALIVTAHIAQRSHSPDYSWAVSSCTAHIQGTSRVFASQVCLCVYACPLPVSFFCTL